MTRARELAELAAAYDSGGLSNMKNRIINGGMVIDQRNAGAAVTANGAFPVDRYQVSNTSDGAYSAQQDSSAPAGFVNSVRVTTTTADASLTTTQQLAFRHIIEGLNVADLGWGTASAQTVTLSFWVRSSLTGTFGGSLQNSAANRSYVFTYTISAANTWEQKTITVPGDTTGTWLTTNGRGIVIWFGLGVGPSTSGTAGSWSASELNSATGAVSVIGTLSATWFITGVQLEKGSTATSFDVRPYGTELALCQRYYYKIGPFDSTDRTIGQGGWFSATTGYAITPFPVTMRIRPTAMETTGTVSHYAAFTASGGGTGLNAVPTYWAYTTVASGAYNFTNTSGGTTGATSVLYSNNAAAFLAWSAEL